MLSSIVNAAVGLQRRYIVLLLVACIVLYGMLFHDVHSIIAASSAALQSYQADASSTGDVTQSKVGGGSVIGGEEKGRLEAEVQNEFGTGEASRPVVEIQEDVLPKDSGVLPPDMVPVDEYIAICASVKNQAKDMTEWLVHHYHHHGIRRFYIMDDGSDPPLSTYQYPGIPRSALTFTYQPRETRVLRMQVMFYKWCLQRYQDRHNWIAFIDADEFFETPGNETLREVLESFDDDDKIGALGVNWKVHTSNGLLERPESVRKSFTECVLDHGKGPQGTVNRHVKSIVKPKKGIAPVGNPHKFKLRGGAKTVGENGDEVTTVAFRQPMTRKRVALHHYATKSKQEYEEKTQRGSGQSNYKKQNFWDEIENQTGHIPCSEMIHYDP